MTSILYAKYNRTRVPKFQTRTTIEQSATECTVVKEALQPEAIPHVISMKEKQSLAECLYTDVKVVNCKIVDDKAVFPYVEGETIAHRLECMLDDHPEDLLDTMDQYLNIVMKFRSEMIVDFTMTDTFRDIFGEYKGDKAVKIGNIDAIFDNFLIQGNEIYLIDYEWLFDFPIPIEYIRFRIVYYFYAKNGNYLKNIISMKEYMQHFGYNEEEVNVFVQLDDNFQQYVHGENRRYIYTSRYYKEIHPITELLNQSENIERDIMDGRNQLQIVQGQLDTRTNELNAKTNELNAKNNELQETSRQLREQVDEVRNLSTIMADKERLIISKDKSIDDFRKNENLLNSIIADQKADIAQRQDKIQNQEEYIQFLKHCIRNPFFALYQVCKKIAKRILPPLVQMGLYCLVTEGWGVFFYKLKNYANGKNQYKTWIHNNENDLYDVTKLEYNPLISVVVPVYNVESSQLIECIESVCKQTYKNWQLCLVDDCSTMESVRTTLHQYEGREQVKIEYRKENGHISRATNTGIAMADGEYIALLDCDDLLAPNALYEMVKLLNENPKYDFIYSDEDKISEDGAVRKDPFFKPDWSPDTFMAIMYTCHFSIFRKSLVDEIGGMRIGYEGSQDYDLVLRIMERTTQIGHVPRILYHWRERKESTANSMTAKPYIIESTKKAKMDALARRGLKGHLECIESITQFRVVYEPMNNPMVSIVIPSKDNYNVLEQCILSIKKQTRYLNYEIIVVDNGSNEENKKKYEQLCEQKHCRYYYEPMTFNFSKMCNIGANHAEGEYLLFLNDDIEIQGENWLSILLGQAQVPYTGAVGCKLLYPDSNLIQHVGVINLEIGPGHAFHGFPDNMNYYYGRNILDYNFAVVTGACLMVKKNKFDQVHGFDETLPVAYNDVELCFKLLECGYYNALRNDVVLIHHESVSRGYDEMTEEKTRRRKQEMEHLYQLHPMFRNYDPCYNPNLVQTRGDFSFNLDKGGNLYQLQEYSRAIIETDGIQGNIDDVNNGKIVKISGWAFVKKHQSAKRVRIVLAAENGSCYFVETDKTYRPDVKNGFHNNRKLAFAGFVTMFDKECMEPGEYSIYLLSEQEVKKMEQKLFV